MAFIPNSEKTRKLLLLYVAEKFTFPLTEDQFIKIVMDNGFMNYVDFKESVNELIAVDHMDLVESAGQTVYKISKDGSYALGQFVDDLPNSTKESFDEYLNDNRHQIKAQTMRDSSYRYLEDDTVEVTCNLRDKDALLMSMKVYLKEKETAKAVCENWEIASPIIYEILMDTLLR